MIAPFAWVRRIVDVVPEMRTIPLFGHAPAFDWTKFSRTLAHELGVQKLEVRVGEQGWKEPHELKKGLGTSSIAIPIAIAPVGTCVWVMSETDMAALSSFLLKGNAKAKAITSEVLQEGFYRFLLLNALKAVQESSPFQNLSLQMSDEEVALEAAYCVDVEIKLENRSFWGRLVIPKELQSSWKSHFSHLSSHYTATDISRKLELALHVKTASVVLRSEEWKKLKVGDFVLLDESSFDPESQTGSGLLMLGETPLFNSKLEPHLIRLTDYAIHYEENMEKTTTSQEEPTPLKELPLMVSVEMARVKMTLDELINMTPGNTIELPSHLEGNVMLTVNGQKVARAELVYLGEKLGVRILEIG